MGLRQQLEGFRSLFGAIAGIASVRDNLGFADLFPWYPSDDFDAYMERLAARRDLGVLVETDKRMFALEEHGGELRFYAGGAGHYVYDQPYELGLFGSVEDAAKYAEAFLVRGLHPEKIAVSRRVRSAQYEWGRAEPGAAADRPRE